AARREGLREKIVKAKEAIIQLERLCQQDLEDILRDRRPHLAIIQSSDGGTAEASFSAMAPSRSDSRYASVRR
ncbi:hypothetical protein FOZ62_015004, partial [Perkinsus olseni]